MKSKYPASSALSQEGLIDSQNDALQVSAGDSSVHVMVVDVVIASAFATLAGKVRISATAAATADLQIIITPFVTSFARESLGGTLVCYGHRDITPYVSLFALLLRMHALSYKSLDVD